MSRTTKWAAAALVILAVVLVTALYWIESARHPSTDDAYVQANVVRMAPEVTGTVTVVYAHDFQTVKAGAPLIQIEPMPFQIALEAAQARLDAAIQEAGAADATVSSAEARVAQRRAELEQAQRDERRLSELAKQRVISASERERAAEALKSARAQLSAARADLETARRKLGERGRNNAQVRAAASAVAQARLDLAHTVMRAPADGAVANLTVRPGATVQQDVPLFAFVESGGWWVNANYEETDLKRLAPGLPAKIEVDMYPGHIFHGTVQSLSPASGVAFSLLPPENATGNWVKVTQRFPVRILIEDADSSHPLRVGASAKVTVDTTTKTRESLVNRNNGAIGG